MFMPSLFALLAPALLVPTEFAPVPFHASPVTDCESRAATTAPADSSLVALYESGVDYPTFLAAARARKEMWERNSAQAVVSDHVLSAARALPGRWRLLVSAVDGCSDSVNTIPYLARLVALNPQLEMRIVAADPGRPIMESHRTPDGRAATPTVVILDADGRDVGCWVERPALLQTKAIEARAAGLSEQFSREKQSWYDNDAGASTIAEVMAVLQAAAAGTPRCDGMR